MCITAWSQLLACTRAIRLPCVHKSERPLTRWSFSYGVGVYSGVAALYVHIMAVNEGAKLFYELHGFTTEQEESSNQAHYR